MALPTDFHRLRLSVQVRIPAGGARQYTETCSVKENSRINSKGNTGYRGREDSNLARARVSKQPVQDWPMMDAHFKGA